MTARLSGRRHQSAEDGTPNAVSNGERRTKGLGGVAAAKVKVAAEASQYSLRQVRPPKVAQRHQHSPFELRAGQDRPTGALGHSQPADNAPSFG